jgi:hypothetical protein
LNDAHIAIRPIAARQSPVTIFVLGPSHIESNKKKIPNKKPFQFTFSPP